VNRTRREDWLEQGFVVLREGGEGALTIDRLCKDLGRTKGAFYHHFADVTAYTDALLTEWEHRNMSPSIPDRRGKRGVFPIIEHALDVPLDRSFRAWGLRSAHAHAFVARIDERRMASLASHYPSAISLAVRRKLARLEYASFVGMQQLYPEISGAAARDLEHMMRAALQSVVGQPQQGRRIAASRGTSSGHRSKLG
jgi:AcrR family transcriptional regulator